MREEIEGTGAEAKDGGRVTVQYVAFDYDTGKEFEATWNEGKPYTFRLGASEVIPGVDRGIEGMRVGARRELIIPPGLAYGADGEPPVVAPNATLVFIIDLLKVD